MTSVESLPAHVWFEMRHCTTRLPSALMIRFAVVQRRHVTRPFPPSGGDGAISCPLGGTHCSIWASPGTMGPPSTHTPCHPSLDRTNVPQLVRLPVAGARAHGARVRKVRGHGIATCWGKSPRPMAPHGVPTRHGAAVDHRGATSCGVVARHVALGHVAAKGHASGSPHAMRPPRAMARVAACRGIGAPCRVSRRAAMPTARSVAAAFARRSARSRRADCDVLGFAPTIDEAECGRCALCARPATSAAAITSAAATTKPSAPPAHAPRARNPRARSVV